MIFHIGADTVVRTQDLVSILSAKAVEASEENRRLLAEAIKTGRYFAVSQDPAKSYVFCTREDVIVAYASPISAATLVKRAERL